MSLRKLAGISVAIAVCAFAVAITSRPASADPEAAPEGVIRTFGFVTSVNADPTTFFLSEESIAVVVAPPDRSTGSALHFIPDPEADFRVDGTTWAYQDATHVTMGPDSTPGAFQWLLTEDTPEPPPLGTFTFTGPDSPLILDQTIFYRTLCSSGDCQGSGNNGKYHVRDPRYADDIFVVVTAVFSH